MPLRAVFFGSPDFAVPSLRALAEAHDVVAVVTQPDRPRGRGRAPAPPAVKVAAGALGLPVRQPETLRRRSVRLALDALAADVYVVVAYGQILRPRLLAQPRLGCINVHASLLPRLRGPAPIQWAVLRGERESGVSIMRLDTGVDTGPVFRREAVRLAPGETAGSLHDRLAPLGARLLVEVLADLEAGRAVAEPQDDAGATFAPMLRKADGRVDFRRPAVEVDRWIRGMDPWPGAFADAGGQRLRLFRSRPGEGSGAPGEVLAVDDRGLLVACGEGAVWIAELQRPGRRRLPARSVLAGFPLPAGTRIQ